MKKTKKMVLASVSAAAMVTAMLPAMAFAADITGDGTADTMGETTVKYEVTEGYTWSVPTLIDFGDNKGVKETSTVNAAADNGDTQKVKVDRNIIPDGKNLKITLAGSGNDGAFTIASGNTVLNYSVAKSGDTDNAINSGDEVLSVAAGTNTGSQGLVFTLKTTTGSAEVAGSYTGTATFTAAVK